MIGTIIFLFMEDDFQQRRKYEIGSCNPRKSFVNLKCKKSAELIENSFSCRIIVDLILF